MQELGEGMVYGIILVLPGVVRSHIFKNIDWNLLLTSILVTTIYSRNFLNILFVISFNQVRSYEKL
jgi:hypothetical protein